MASYNQTTIHSRISKSERTNGDGTMGRLIRGTLAGTHNQIKRAYRSFSNQVIEQSNDPALENPLEGKVPEQPVQRRPRILEQKSLKKKSNELILFESAIFPAIYFKKTTMRSVLQEFVFPSKTRALPPNDDRTPLVFQIIANLFNEIVFYVFNLLVAQNTITSSYIIFFSDSETIPFTKCCNSPVHIEMQLSGTGKIMCNAPKCLHPSLAEFLIGYEDGKKLWPTMTYLSVAPEKDTHLKQKISRHIHTGKYKSIKLKRLVSEASKEVQDIFQKSKFEDFVMDTDNMKKPAKAEDRQSNLDDFLTNPPATVNKNTRKDKSLSDIKDASMEVREQEILDPTEKNPEFLKIKVHYMLRKQKNLQKSLAKGIVEESKVFHKKFEMFEKMNELLGTGDDFSMNRTKVNFPKLMSQINTQNERRAKSMSRTANSNKNPFPNRK